MVNIVLILIALRPKYCLENVENSISKHLNFKIIWGSMPQTPLGSSRLRQSKNRLPPNFPVRTSTSKLIDSTAPNWKTCIIYKFKAYLESLETLENIKILVMRNNPCEDNFYANKSRYKADTAQVFKLLSPSTRQLWPCTPQESLTQCFKIQ